MKVSYVIKNALLETMDEFHRVCEENDLKYYLIGGSLIGAIRHKGCIPWDDDLDVIMPQKDFNKLLTLKKLFPSPLQLQYRTFKSLTPETTTLPIARLENTRIVIDEGFYSNITSGIFIDIFCFNDTFNSQTLQKTHFKIAKVARTLLQLKERTYSRKKYSSFYLTIFNLISYIFALLPMSFFNILLSLSEKIGRIGGKKQYIANLHGAWGIKELAPKKIFQKRKLYDFEGRKYWSIEDADAWLRPIYGDYMQLPPKEARQPKHIGKIISINGVKIDS